MPDDNTDGRTGDQERHDRFFNGRWELEDPEVLRDLADWPHAKTRHLNDVEQAIIAEAMHIGRHRWTSYSRSKEWYTDEARKYLPRKFGYRSMVNAVDRLEYLGLLDHDRRPQSSASIGYQSRLIASPLLMSLARAHPRLRCAPPRSPLVLRDEDKHPIKFRETRWTRGIVRNVAEIDEALSSARIDLDPDTPCLWRYGNFLEVANRYGDPVSVHPAHVPIRRVFNRDWNNGGRFAGPPYHSWPRFTRNYITLDGQPTVELDYGQTHPRMLCARGGLDIAADEDVYDIAGFKRDLVKLTFNIVINAPNLLSALRAAADTKPRWKGKYATAAAITEAIKARYPALIPYLHTGAGPWLMRIESDVAENILLHLARRGIVALPVHDSFVIDAKNETILAEAMADSWLRIVGSEATISRKKKPSVSAPLQRNGPTYIMRGRVSEDEVGEVLDGACSLVRNFAVKMDNL
jgi:hypothetical protein